MSSTSVASSSAVPTTVCTSNLYDIPVDDIACAMPYSDKNTGIMEKCCGDANIVSYFNQCGIYCIVKDQTVDDLTSCLFKNGATEGPDVFCNSNGTASATATGQADIPKTASASVVVTAGSSSSDDDDSDDNDDSDSSAASSAPTSSDNAAPGLRPQSGVNLSGVVIGALLFSATAFGAFQI